MLLPACDEGTEVEGEVLEAVKYLPLPNVKNTQL